MSEDRTMRVSRDLSYSPKEIYRAFSSGDLLALWWGPEGFSNSFDIFDFTEGGRWQFTMHGPDGSHYKNRSVFEKLVPDRKIVIYHDCPPYFRLIVVLTPINGGTYLTWEQVFDDAETARAVRQRVGAANEQNIDRLTQVLKQAFNQ